MTNHRTVEMPTREIALGDFFLSAVQRQIFKWWKRLRVLIIRDKYSAVGLAGLIKYLLTLFKETQPWQDLFVSTKSFKCNYVEQVNIVLSNDKTVYLKDSNL